MDEAIPLRSPNRFETVKLSATPREKAPAMVRLHLDNEKNMFWNIHSGYSPFQANQNTDYLRVTLCNC